MGHDMDLQKGAGAKSGRTTTFSNLSGHVAQVRASTQCPVFGTVYKEYIRRDSNPQPSVPKTDALSS